jgi:hypothetical protein
MENKIIVEVKFVKEMSGFDRKCYRGIDDFALYRFVLQSGVWYVSTSDFEPNFEVPQHIDIVIKEKKR